MLARSSDLQDQVQPSRGFHRWLRRPLAPVRSPFQPWLSPEPHPPPARHARPGTAPSPHPVLQKHPLRGSVSRADSGPTRPRLLLRSPQIRPPFSFSLYASKVVRALYFAQPLSATTSISIEGRVSPNA